MSNTQATVAGLELVSLKDRRILLIGGSSGIGPVIGQALCGEGAHVAFAARRVELCEEHAANAPGTAIGVGCDVSDPEQCERVVAETVERLGGLDDIVYAAGLIAMVALADADADWWRDAFATNVMGPALITRAALPHLQRSKGTAVYISSVSAHTHLWPGIGVYTTTKAALNKLVDNWRLEHPEIGFARVAIGPTEGGATTSRLHPSVMLHQPKWSAMQTTSGARSSSESIARQVLNVLTDPSRIWDVTVQPRDPELPWG